MRKLNVENVEVVFCTLHLSLIVPQNNDFLKVLWTNVFKSLTTTAKHFFLAYFFLTKIDKKTQLKMKGTSGNSKHKHVKAKANFFFQALDRNFDHLQTHNDCHDLQLFTFIDKTSRQKYFLQHQRRIQF